MTNANKNPTALTEGVHHAGLTVPDVVATSRFFIDALGFEQVAERPNYPAIFVSDGTIMITLWQAADPAAASAFDRRNNIGLHHLAFRTADVDRVHAVLTNRDDVEIEFAPESVGGSETRHLMCRIPGGVRVEFIQPAS